MHAWQNFCLNMSENFILSLLKKDKLCIMIESPENAVSVDDKIVLIFIDTSIFERIEIPFVISTIPDRNETIVS